MESATSSSYVAGGNDNQREDAADINSRMRLKILLRSLKDRHPSMTHMDQVVFILALSIYETPQAGALAELIFPYLDSIPTQAPENNKLRLDQSIHLQERVVQAAPEGHKDIPSWLTNLGISYRTRFARFNDPEDLKRALTHAQQAVELSLDGDPNLPARLNNLGNSYFSMFQRHENISDLDKAIESQLRATSLSPDTHPTKPSMLHNLASLYLARFERRSDQSDISDAITCYDEALALVSGSPDALLLEGLGNAYSARFEQLGQQSDIDQAISYQSEALALIPDQDPDKPRVLSNLGISFFRLFTRSGELSDIDTAIQHYADCINLTDEDSPELPARMNDLGTACERRFEYSGEREDIDQAVEYCTFAIDHSPGDDPNKAAWLDGLGVVYQNRYKQLGDSQDLSQALQLQQQAVALAETCQKPGKPKNSLRLMLNNLGSTYHTEFERTGRILDIDASIECLLRSLEDVPDEYAHKHVRLNNLGLAYLARFERLGEMGDIDEAIECHKRAVELVPHGHRDEPWWIGNLGISYMRRFKRSKEEADIDKAIESHLKLPGLVREGERFEALKLIGSSHYTRFQHLQRVEDLETAIGYYILAEALTPPDHAKWYSPLCNLGRSYLDRFKCTKQLPDLESSIDYLTRVVTGIGDENADRTIWLTDLGEAYCERFEHLNDHDDLVHSIGYLRQAVNSSGYPFVRFHAAYTWVHAASYDNDSEMEALTHLMALLPQVIWLGVPISRRYKDISSILQEVVPHAVTVAINHGDFNRATEWFEEGRSIVWKQMLQLRTPVDKLKAVDAELAERVEWVAKALDDAASRPERVAGKDGEASSRRHHRLALDWAELLERVRGISGFEDFLQPKKISSLVRAAESRTVVVINVMSRCDALIIRRGSTIVQHLNLNTFSYEKAVDAHKILIRSLEAAGVRERHDSERRPLQRRAREGGQFEKILATLWEHIVRPVLDYLGYLNSMAKVELPHIAWCTTGPLAFLPLHAAGIYGDSNSTKVFDYVVSSYTPTLSALVSISPALDTSDFTGILAVGQAHAHGAAPLPGTIAEMAALRHQAECHGLSLAQLEGPEATSVATLSAMESYAWIHLACHATQDVVHPTASAFQLHDGPLDLSSITKRSLQNKGLAFLSACQTATGDETLPDEAVHLAAGMLMAGYSSVVATMWSIKDQDAPKVAEWVYKVLLDGDRLDCARSARALHDAVSELRIEVGEKAFARWVPYIHIGV